METDVEYVEHAEYIVDDQHKFWSKPLTIVKSYNAREIKERWIKKEARSRRHNHMLHFCV